MARGDDGQGTKVAAPEHDVVLASLRAFHEEHVRREKGLVLLAIQWVKLNPAGDQAPDAAHAVDDEAMWQEMADKGCPRVEDLTIPAFAQAAGLSEYQARKLIRQSVMLIYLLPRVWKRVRAGEVDVFRARLLADDCWDLTPAAVDYVDKLMSLSTARHTQNGRENVIEEARLRYMSREVAEEEERAQERRCFEVMFDRAEHGKVPVWGLLDLVDAVDLDQALTEGAAQLKEEGSQASLAVRRSWALGDLARNAGGQAQSGGRVKTLMYIHMSSEALTETQNPITTHVARVAGPGISRNMVVDSTVVQGWFTRPRKGVEPQVRIQPVIDLQDEYHVEAYQIPHRLKQQAQLRDGTCVFPWCTRLAHQCDCDHMIPWEPAGKGGPTCSCNVAPLCRFHHRAKTHADNHMGNRYTWWNYESLGEGKYLWKGPKGTKLLRTNTGVYSVGYQNPEPKALLRERVEAAQHVVDRIGDVIPQPPVGEDNSNLCFPQTPAQLRAERVAHATRVALDKTGLDPPF